MIDTFAKNCPNKHPTDWDINEELKTLPDRFTPIDKDQKPGIAILRWFCKHNLFYLCYHVLGYKDVDNELHPEVCEFADEHVDDPFLILLPRGHFKSTLITVGMSMQDILRDTAQRNLITSSTPSLVSQFSLEIRSHFETNQILKFLFPEVCYDNPAKQSKRWNDKEMVVKRTKIRREPSLTFLSAGSMAVGYHFTRRIYDDIVNYENTATNDLIQKLHTWHSYTKSLGAGAVERYVGTRYHFNDIYEDLIKLEAKGKIAVYTRKAIENGVVIFPGQFSIQLLDELRDVQGDYIFSAQYMNDPTDKENAKFREEDLKVVEDWKDRDGNHRLPEMNTFVIFDPNFTEKEDKNSSNNAVVVVGVDAYKNKFLLDRYSARGSIDEVADRAIDFLVQYKPAQQVIHIEDCPVYKYLKKLFYDRFEKEKRNFGVVPIKIRNRDKFSRIMRLQPDIQAGRWWIAKSFSDVVEELTRFPKFKHRDVIDGMSYVYDVGYEPEEYTKYTGTERQRLRHRDDRWNNRFSGVRNSYMIA